MYIQNQYARDAYHIKPILFKQGVNIVILYISEPFCKPVKPCLS
ncbi:hypothetical protein LEJE111609_20065 [Lelliottia jeotgali]